MLPSQSAKPKTCCMCPKEFIPRNSTHVVCGFRCAMRKLKADQTAEKERDKAKREALKTLPVLKREAQTEFNKWVRARDYDKPCISCGAPPPDLSGFHAGRDAGHYRSVGSAAHLRFHEDNCHAQCVRCNQYGAGRAVDYRLGLVSRIGLVAVEALESDNTPRKWTREELIAIKETYRTKRKELEKERE